MKNTTLDQLKPGDEGKVKALNAQGQLRTRLMDMGMITGTTVTMVRKAPLGDPLEVEIRGYSLSLRKEEAKLVDLEIA